MGPDGTFTIANTWEETGQGGDMGTLGTAHEALRPLNVPPEKIKLDMNESPRCPDSGGSGASRQQVMTGRAIVEACGLLLKALQKEDGTYRSYDEMVAENLPLKYEFNYAKPSTPTDKNAQGDPIHIHQFGVFLAEVKVDTQTGKTTVEKLTLAADIGSICNKLVVDGQLYGGLAQGIGLALSEDFEDIKKHSSMIGAGFPYIKDIPDNLELMFIETPRPEGPFGAAGCGELPLTSPHAAIINAIHNACGAWVTRLPALPEKVLAALKK
jgi:aldehyde oxidoreductase